MRYGILGGGRMGEVIASSIKDMGEEIVVCEKNEERAQKLKEKGYEVEPESRTAAFGADVVVVAVKPKDAGELLSGIVEECEGKLVISIVAGMTIHSIWRKLKQSRIARVMPNTPLLVGCGATCYSLSEDAKRNDEKIVEEIFGKKGVCYKVPEEMMDVVTALSGSGPAYFYFVIDAIAKEAVKQGMEEKIAYSLASQTALGAGMMAAKTGKGPNELIEMVASPGGTTIEGLRVLRREKVAEAFANAVEAAANKSKQLSK